MSVTQIPPRDPVPPPPPAADQPDLFEAQHWETAYRRFNPNDVPHLLIQLQDDLSRSRKREAVWLSVVLHLLIVILIYNSPKFVDLWPWRHPLVVTVPDLNSQKDATYLALPPDEQNLTKRPDAKVISDKDRIATSKTPQINHQELKKILDAARAGRPGMPAAPQQAPAMAQNQPPPQPQQESPQQPPNSGFVAPAPANPAQLQAPPQGRRPTPSFTVPQTAGSAIEQAAAAAAANRGHYAVGEGGDYGLNQRNGAKVLDQMEVLTPTLGVDFGPYLNRVLQIVKENWYRGIPESAMPPIMKKGKVSIEFVILSDGRISGMNRDESSGDIALDRAAWGGITASNPFPPLPREFIELAKQQGAGQYLGLRINFYYNPDKSDLQ
jgi:TonB family protein